MIETLTIEGRTVLAARPSRQHHPPVLFVHGYYAIAEFWTGWLERFAARGIPAFAVNLRGRHGSMEPTDVGRVSIADYVRDAEAIVHHLGRPSIVGHSMGGLIAQVVASHDLVRATVLIAPAPPRGIPLLTWRIVRTQTKNLARVFGSLPMPPNVEDLRELAFNRAPPELQKRGLAALVTDSGRAGRDMSVIGVPVDAKRVRAPMLVIAAEKDQFIPAPIVARVARRYGATLETMPGRGHMLTLEPEWEALADRVASWLVAI